jgi:hypothetical protein
MNPPAANEKFCQPGKIFSLWLIVLGPAVLWLAQFQVIYTLVAWACKTGRHGVIPATSIFSFLLAAGLGWLSFSRWRETSQPPAADPAHDERRRSRFMAQLGAMMTALFALLIAVQGAAYLFLDPCAR